MISDFQAARVLNHIFGRIPYDPPASLRLGLSYTPITSNGTGFTEPAASTGYARMEFNNNEDTWQVSTGFVKTNKAQLMFDPFTSGSSTDPNVTYWFITDVAEGGAAMYYGELSRPRPIIAESQIWINSGEIILESTNPV